MTLCTLKVPNIVIPLLIGGLAAACLAGGLAQAQDMPADASGSGAPVVQQIKPLAAGEMPDFNPIALYGESTLYDVLRKGKKVGEHRMYFERSGDELVVKADFRLEIPFLFFTAYRFEYQSTEVWRGKQLMTLTATVNNNGDVATTSAELNGDSFVIEGPQGSTVLNSWIFPTNHWNRGQVNARTILNTLTGKVAYVETIPKGVETVETATGEVEAAHYVYTGDLRDTDVWYGSEGRWVKMRFKAKDNSLLDYVCRQCGLPGDEAAPDEMEMP